MENSEVVLYEKKDSMAFVTLNRPYALNAFNLQMRDELYQVLQAIKQDSEVRVMVLKGAGEKAFCAGADITEFGTAPSPVIARQVRWERDVWGLFLSIEKPLIAALHSYVLGSGLEMALCCDIRIASEDAKFGLPEVGIGIIPGAGGSQTLPRLIGRARALEIILTGRYVEADEALRIKLVNMVVPRGKLFTKVIEIADSMKNYSPSTLAAAKQAVTRGLDLSLEQGLELEAKLAVGVLASFRN